MESKLIIILLSVCLFLSCTPDKPAVPPEPVVKESPQVAKLKAVAQDVKEDTAVLGQTTGDIKATATEGQQITPVNAKPLLDPYWVRILLAAGVQEKVIEDLKSKDEQLNIVIQQLRDKELEVALGKQRLALQGTQLGQKNSQLDSLLAVASQLFKKNETDAASLESSLQRYMHLLTVAGIICVAISISLIFSGNRFGMFMGIASAGVVCLSLVIGKYEFLAPLLGVTGVLAAAVVIWSFYRHRQEKAELNKELRALKMLEIRPEIKPTPSTPDIKPALDIWDCQVS